MSLRRKTPWCGAKNTTKRGGRGRPPVRSQLHLSLLPSALRGASRDLSRLTGGGRRAARSSRGVMADGQSQKGVSDCYVFKSRLLQYAQKVSIPTPEYHTLKEGPSHEPVFKSTVVVNNVTYESLPGFFNRKSAEQSAAEVALLELEKSGKTTECLPTLHETGLCKNLLQEYAQKMNYAIPSYQCNKQASGETLFSCTVEIGGIQYIGAAAKSKKEAEIKAARTALLAIQSSGNEPNVLSQYTVLPVKKKAKDAEAQTGTVKELKRRRTELKKKWPKRKFPRNKGGRSKSNKNEQGTTSGDGPGIEFVNGGTLETVGASDHGQHDGPNMHSNGQGMNTEGSNALVRKVTYPGLLSFETDVNYLPPLVMDANTVPQVTQFGNPAVVTE
ncbi:hypothetical protein Taro_006974 [Colocasia esculenta]|uniref:DRBM domain-containing protein n=1 Tax=Colocasia esculenta TaxID=4460 RepID=A0A843TYG3_COLES|nr:hypothetical protein [Colocasia esculenta]